MDSHAHIPKRRGQLSKVQVQIEVSQADSNGLKGCQILVTSAEGYDRVPGIREIAVHMGRIHGKILPAVPLLGYPLPERVFIQHLLRVPGDIIYPALPIHKGCCADSAVPFQHFL